VSVMPSRKFLAALQRANSRSSCIGRFRETSCVPCRRQLMRRPQREDPTSRNCCGSAKSGDHFPQSGPSPLQRWCQGAMPKSEVRFFRAFDSQASMIHP
jgi:hypothetical protein